MTPEELLQEWESDGEEDSVGMRVQRVQAVRTDLMEYTGEYIPRSLAEIEALILESPQRKGVITRKLREAVSSEEEEEEDPEE